MTIQTTFVFKYHCQRQFAIYKWQKLVSEKFFLKLEKWKVAKSFKEKGFWSDNIRLICVVNCIQFNIDAPKVENRNSIEWLYYLDKKLCGWENAIEKSGNYTFKLVHWLYKCNRQIQIYCEFTWKGQKKSERKYGNGCH